MESYFVHLKWCYVTCIAVMLSREQNGIAMCISAPEIIVVAKDIFVALAAAVTASVAIIGLTNWNRELRGKAAFEVARGLAKATYKLREEIRSCRTPLIRSNEFPNGYSIPASHKDKAQDAQAYAHVYSTRWQPIWIALQEFDTQTLEAEVLWGADIRKKTDALRDCLNELNAATEALIENAASGGEDFSMDRNFGKQMRAIISASASDSENAFSQRLEAALHGIEAVMRDHLRRS